MTANATTDKSFLVTHRRWAILAGILLFLPPLSFLFQLTQDASFCGSWCPRMFFTWNKGTSIGQFLLGFVRSYMGVLLVVSVLAATFFYGRYWCSHLCPVGGSMEAGSSILPRWMKIEFSRVPAPPFRYGYMAVYLIAPAIGIGSICCNYCNFATVPRLFGAAFVDADMAYFFRTAGLINLGLVLVLGVFARGGRAYCNLLCPIGALDALSNRVKTRLGMRVRVDAGLCNGCGECAKVCPTWAIDVKDSAKIDQLSCMPCRKCEKICPVEAISYGKPQA